LRRIYVKLVKIILTFLIVVLRTLLYDWAISLCRVLKQILDRCRRNAAKKRLPGRQGKASAKPCVPLSDPALKRPDPLIYDQYYLMAFGFAVTWDNPDIWLELGGVVVPSEQLLPNTTYDVFARIWNSSTEGVVSGLPINFSYLSFGAGVQSNPMLPGPGTVIVSLGVKGSPLCPAIATTKWTTPPAGHYCIQVSFSWLDDSNPWNNLGQENTAVGISHSPVNFPFQLRNNKRSSAVFHFEVDTYTLPPLPNCQPPARTGKQVPTVAGRPFDPREVPPQHNRANYPLPPGWSVTFAPAQPHLAGGAEITVVSTIAPPAGFKGRQPINVHIFSEAGLTGGVTFYVQGT
jgi:hypothetical protein